MRFDVVLVSVENDRKLEALLRGRCKNRRSLPRLTLRTLSSNNDLTLHDD